MSTTFEPLPLGEYRASILQYLQGVTLPLRSTAWTIIERSSEGAQGRSLLRPTLVLWACDACGASLQDAIPVAAAVDLFDRFMSLHDELVADASDGDAGSLVARWGLGQSLNAGDALYALALRTLAQDVIDVERRSSVASALGRAVLEAIEGRTSDVEREVRGERDGLLQRVRSIRRRGATLTGAAMAAGAIVAGAPEHVVRGFERAGRLLAAASTTGDRNLCRRIAAKAVAAVDRCDVGLRPARAFHEVVDYVVEHAA
jgi:geranylgeranyl pyrophosphate synthase